MEQSSKSQVILERKQQTNKQKTAGLAYGMCVYIPLNAIFSKDSRLKML